MKNTDLKTKVIIIICCIVVITTIGAYIYKNSKEEDYENYYITEENSLEVDDGEDIDKNTEKSTIMIHVTGEVSGQGVVILPERCKSCRCNRGSRRRNG